jgi:hypothetical protein
MSIGQWVVVVLGLLLVADIVNSLTKISESLEKLSRDKGV